jgi:hypothetical protein
MKRISILLAGASLCACTTTKTYIVERPPGAPRLATPTSYRPPTPIGPTPYQPLGTDGRGGYKVTQLSERDFLVIFIGNGFIPPQLAWRYTKMKAAETLLHHGFPYFAMTHKKEVFEPVGIDGVKPAFSVIVRGFYSPEPAEATHNTHDEFIKVANLY